VGLSLYKAKRWLMTPVIARRRRRTANKDPYILTLYEEVDFRPSAKQFFRARVRDRDLLVDALLPDGAVALDVGAFEGEWSASVLRMADERGTPDVRIHAFEPEAAAADRFAKNVTDPRVTLHRYGLAGSRRTERLAVVGPGSSIYRAPTDRGATGSADIELRDIDTVLRDLGVERVALAKINIEGGEFELIDRLHETRWLPRIDTLIVQFHEFAPGAYQGRRRNRRQLARTHTETWCFPWAYERWDLKPLAPASEERASGD
jgi:FkbM family methyltransferase